MKKLLISMALVVPVLFMTSCSDDDDNAIQLPVEVSKTYLLGPVSNPAISGTAKFIKNLDNSTTIQLQLTGTSAGVQYPAHIHFNTAAESGAIALTLGTVNGDTGYSAITTTTLNDNSAISYEDLLDFDGYINVHNPVPDDLSVLVAQGDIGENELTGDAKTYPLAAVSDPTISGNVTFEKRANGESLATIQLVGTTEGAMHPAHIHSGSISNPVPAPPANNIIFTFNPVNGDTGKSVTNVSELMDDTDFDYSDILAVNGYVNVHLSDTDIATLVAQGNIGSNE